MKPVFELSKRRRLPETAVRIEARRRRKRESILNAAQEILDEKGPHKMSLRAVARRAGCAPATLYEYFDSLFDLLDALADRPRAQLQVFLQAAQRDNAGMATDLMIRLAVAYVRFARRHPKEFRLLFETVSPQQTGALKEAKLHPVLQPLLDSATAGQMTGELHGDDDPERIAWGLWALAHGIATLRSTGTPMLDADADAADISVLQAYIGGWLV